MTDCIPTNIGLEKSCTAPYEDPITPIRKGDAPNCFICTLMS